MRNEDNLGYLLNKAARMTKWYLTNRLSQYGITSPQFAVLKDISVSENLYSNNEEKYQLLSPAAIAERLRTDRPTMTGIIKRLAKDGWVFKLSNPQDGRSQMIALTDKAKGLLTEFEVLSNKTMERATAGLTNEDITCLKKYLMKIIDNLS